MVSMKSEPCAGSRNYLSVCWRSVPAAACRESCSCGHSQGHRQAVGQRFWWLMWGAWSCTESYRESSLRPAVTAATSRGHAHQLQQLRGSGASEAQCAVPLNPDLCSPGAGGAQPSGGGAVRRGGPAAQRVVRGHEEARRPRARHHPGRRERRCRAGGPMTSRACCRV